MPGSRPAAAQRRAVCLSFPTQRMVDLLEAMRRWDLEPKRLKLLSHTPTKPPYALLVEGVRQGKPVCRCCPAQE